MSANNRSPQIEAFYTLEATITDGNTFVLSALGNPVPENRTLVILQGASYLGAIGSDAGNYLARVFVAPGGNDVQVERGDSNGDLTVRFQLLILRYV